MREQENRRVQRTVTWCGEGEQTVKPSQLIPFLLENVKITLPTVGGGGMRSFLGDRGGSELNYGYEKIGGGGGSRCEG